MNYYPTVNKKHLVSFSKINKYSNGFTRAIREVSNLNLVVKEVAYLQRNIPEKFRLSLFTFVELIESDKLQKLDELNVIVFLFWKRSLLTSNTLYMNKLSEIISHFQDKTKLP